jgi:type IV secretion system protein VirB1
MLSVAVLALGCGLLTNQELLEAIVQVESGGNAHALNVNGGVELVRQPRSREEAVAMARWLERHGYSFDVGLAQLNSANLARLGLDVASAFEPCANLRAASRVLEECLYRARARLGDGARALNAAVSCYNTGHFTRGVANGYVAAVRSRAPKSLSLRSHDALRAIATDSDRAGRCANEERSGSRGVPSSGRFGRTARRNDAFARRLADAFGAARAANQEGVP